MSVKENKVFIAPVETPFYIILAHELIHLKHYLEEQVFIEDSLPCTVAAVLQDYSKDPTIRHFFTSSPSADNVLENLRKSSEVRRPIFHSKVFAYSRLGSADLLWSLDKKDPASLSKLAYSIAGAGYIPNVVDQGFFPESAGRDPRLFETLVRDLEERRTVVGPDRDGITEDALRMEAGLPIRYIYQDEAMFESLAVMNAVFPQSDIASYIEEHQKDWKWSVVDETKVAQHDLSFK